MPQDIAAVPCYPGQPPIESPMKRFRPTVDEVKRYASENEISRRDAKHHLTRLNMIKAANDARTFEDLQPLVRVLISLAVFEVS